MQKPKPRRVILLSGPIASGKTTLSQLLAERLGFCVVSTRELLAQGAADRLTLQAAGASSDDATVGRWVLDGIIRMRELFPHATFVVVDAVRTRNQIRWVRDALGESVVHVHLTATKESLSKRYEFRSEGYSYGEATKDRVEHAVNTLAYIANLVIDTTNRSPLSVMDRLASTLCLTS